MAFRGRGRGRGRGPQRPGPVIRDEDGSMVTSFKLEGPPPLFPKVEALPERPDISQQETAFLVERRRMLHTFWNQSAYYLEAKSESASAGNEVDRYADAPESSSSLRRKPLSLYLLLTPDFFPAELLGNVRKRKASNQGGIWTLQSNGSTFPVLSRLICVLGLDLGRLDKLAKLEVKIGEKGEGEEEKKDEEDEENVDQAFDEEEEEIDDYNMIQEVDDDEEYDYEEAVDDEGPVF